jgi:hypothetical protein
VKVVYRERENSVYILRTAEKVERDKDMIPERHNTAVCAFETQSPKITAFEIHEWIYESLRLPEADVTMAQID